MTRFPTDRHGLIHRATAMAAGFTDAELARAVRNGDLVRVIRGVFVDGATRSPEAHHRLVAIAVAGQSTSMVISHQSAAAIHRLAMLKPQLGRVHTIVAVGAGAHRRSARHEHEAAVTPEEVTVIDGVAVTTLERTAVDVACTTTMGFAGALAVFDAALRAGADREVMDSMLQSTRRGIGQARRALRHADRESENPGESWGRAQMIDAGLPIARLQHEFHHGDGTLVARTDYDWDGLLVGEFDGMTKYQKYLRRGETPFDAMRREKVREDALRKLGIMVIRWTWDDLEHGRVVPLVRDWLQRLQLIAA
ncbi:type IV toxin-antitoxin system AbiEi family antitoxin domain-containing protein [Williamsia herbipolensis]|uniref:type IV toxin-antitoxin system AbiEi family antitoxin domain-containing protein n=1 Tax=Williamsia herbipolensis TaxID=1603258 RepID=UPI0005F76738|nr:type IV toxin-antitoxin system AbiEi family antitoxin domain-containing protein [Williamsia herbipolensis]